MRGAVDPFVVPSLMCIIFGLLPGVASASASRPLRSPRQPAGRGQRSARMGGRGRPPAGTPTLSGIEIRAAGVIPFCRHDGRLMFFMQDMTNGSRVGQLCDFGGRSEADDADLFFTAARELEEETSAVFGSADEVAMRLRREGTIRILNPTGKYVSFFLKVDYVNPSAVPSIDATDENNAARDCRWYRPDELLKQAEHARLQGRLLTPSRSRFDALSKRQARSASSFDRAVRKTLALENREEGLLTVTHELKVLAEMASLPSQAEASLSKAFGPVTKRSKAR
jgi:8-oxo-dGTP pyrophosphatase MutT (NUDIX family)